MIEVHCDLNTILLQMSFTHLNDTLFTFPICFAVNLNGMFENFKSM